MRERQVFAVRALSATLYPAMGNQPVDQPTNQSTSPDQYNLFGVEFKADPYPTYAAMRTHAPFCRRTAMDGQTTIWFITRYADVAAILRDSRFVKDIRSTMTPVERRQMPPPPPMIDLLSNHMLNLDPPDHTRLRSLVNKAFTVRMMQGMESRIQRIADDLLDKVQRRGHMDLVDEFAFPLPITVIAELLGIPPRDRNRFRQWSHAFVSPSPNLERSAKKYRKAKQLIQDFTGYMARVIAARRETPRPDLITSLIEAEEAGDTLSQEELYSMVSLLILAGHETAVNMIGNSVLALLQHPEQLALLRTDPSLIESAVEELLRYDGPVERATMRFAAEDIEMGEHTIRRGDVVSLVLASADRDPAVFDHPDRLDITRTDNRHLAFGQGIHYCLGAPLARLEGRIAIATLLRRLPNLRLAVPVADLRWRTVPVIRGMQHMPVAWDEPQRSIFHQGAA